MGCLMSYIYFATEFTWISTLLVFVCTFLVLYLNTRRQHGIPPGPVLLPVIGNLHNLLGGDVQKNLRHLRQQYGHIYGLYIGKELTIFLNGYDVIHDALVKHGRLFSSRPISEFHKLAMKYPGIIFSNGQVWKEHRTFTMKCLQEVCFKDGGRNIEHIIYNELDHLTDLLEQKDEPLVLDEHLHTSVGNVICMVLHRKRFDFEDKIFNTVLTYLRKLAEEFTTAGLITNCFPFLKLLPGDALGIRRMLKKAEWIRAVFWPPSTSNSEGDTISITELYLDEIATKEDNPDSIFTEENVQSALYDLLAAGIDTTAGVILWTVLYLIRYPEIQRKMFEEIKTVIGLDNKPTVKDRHDLPYVEAVILEVLRISAVVPFGVPHTVTRDTAFLGYLFPANCAIITNLESVLNDPNAWDTPDEFLPERFLSKDKCRVNLFQEFVPFSIGPRSCLGESLARIEIFLMITTLVQKFEFLPEKEDERPEAKGHFGVTWRPCPYRVRVVKRLTLSPP